ncbi:VOC family protein [Salinarimonas ramus]|uniref:VOC family protein n=1 Tax=Salinarimonas ramus TaxID=690164 RepID=A0A917QDZ2_9HYPH|nr:VOC family protein [Salinarimonas ramus]GGK45894.1 VOC family protein [Salinarimonas ramus]
MRISANISFDGRAREAFAFYRELLGGELVMLPFADLPGMGEIPANAKDHLAHVQLRVGDQVLMGGDMHWSMPYETPRSAWITLEVESVAEAKRLFAALAEGGEVGMPMAATSWSPAFGMTKDRFGAPWIVIADAKDAT